MADRLHGAHGGPVVVGDLRRVHLVGEPDALAVEDVEDGVPAGGEVVVPGVDEVLAGRREHRDVLPDRRAGEADDDVDTELARGAGGHLHLLGRPLANALGIAVAPDPVGQDALGGAASMGSSQTAWPLRWLLIAKTWRPYLLSSSFLAGT